MEHFTDETLYRPFPEGFHADKFRRPVSQPSAKTRRPFRERVLRNCTIGGILLAAALSILLLDTPLTNRARTFLQSAVSEETTVGKAIDSLWGTVQTVLGREETPIEIPLHDTSVPDFDRIDEELLDALRQDSDTYNLKNYQAPSGE